MRALVVAGLVLAVPGVAQACGGLFCNNTLPVDQTAEEILFVQDAAAKRTEMHVKVMYSGPAEDFSWVVPVPAVPEISLGTDALFQTLSLYMTRHRLDDAGTLLCDDGFNSTAGGGNWPRFQTPRFTLYPTYGTGTGTGTGGGGGGGPPEAPPVTVVATDNVGAYETVTLQATDSAALVAWLADNDYDLPPGFEPVIAPYVSPDSAFVAMKLEKNADSGAIAPLVMSFPGTAMSIPIQLTSVAAADDMKLRVHVLGEHRAVPESYLHVDLNPLLIDWWGDGSNARGWNYENLASRAVDEAGGHGFVTDYAGDPLAVDWALPLVLHHEDWTADAFDGVQDAWGFLAALESHGFPADPPTLAVVTEHVIAPAGLPYAATDLASCIGCFSYELEGLPIDVDAAVADLEEFVIEPRAHARALLETYPWITRMTSTASADEMTVDPVFVTNPHMGEVPMLRTAVQAIDCSHEPNYRRAPRSLNVGDGYPPLNLPNIAAIAFGFEGEPWWIHTLDMPAAAIVSRTSSSGPPEVLIDNRDLIGEIVEQSNRDRRTGFVVCGCQSGSGGGAAGALVGLVLVGLRRRR